MGAPELDVTQTGGGPCAFVASQSGGNTGGVAPSKFSVNPCRSQHPGHGSGVGVGPVAARTFARPLSLYSREAEPPTRGATAREELITAAAKKTTAAAPIVNVMRRVITDSLTENAPR
jgi:hypothetical protein